MTLHWPHALWLLLLPLALLARGLLRRRATIADDHPKIRRAEARHSSLSIDHSSLRRGGAPGLRVFFPLALAAAALALARPQWGRLEEPVFDQAREIIIALDLSRSMSAEDVKPSRLERARLLITSLLERLKGERVGLVVFSGTAFLQSPLSSDYEILREFLPVLEPGYLPEGGTNYDALLDTTLAAFGASGSADRFLIVLSDGEALDENWRRHLGSLATKEIRVLGLGIGTAEGAMIPDGAGAFVKDERGAVVLSRLDSSTLRELSEKTGGVYADASSWVDLSQLIQSTVEKGRRGEFSETSRVRLAERFQWPLAASLMLFLLAFWREFPVRPKPRPLQLAGKAAALALLPAALFTPGSAHAEEPSVTAAPLTRLVGRLALRDPLSARDYAELARATATFGERARAGQEPVPAGAVRDGLAAVAAGEALDARAADWPALRRQLEALLAREEPPAQDDQEQPKPDQQPDQNKNGSSEKQDGEKGERGESSPENPEPKPGESKSDPASKPEEKQPGGGGQPSPSEPQSADDSGKKPDQPGQSAFGDMNERRPEAPQDPRPSAPPEAPPPPAPDSGEMQQVGGATDRHSNDPARHDPALTAHLQQLDQVKQGDSPARLFQLLQEPSSGSQPASRGKDW